MYLGRLQRHGPTLNCVVTLTEERARAAAVQADEEIAAGEYRGPLHGIPYGVKDIIAARGYPTTWGTPPFVDRVIDQDATVVQRLDEAGAILVAKLTTGELAFGDRWFGGRTNSPWNPEVGSSGSSAGSGAATAAGLVGFAIGTDTGGLHPGPLGAVRRRGAATHLRTGEPPRHHGRRYHPRQSRPHVPIRRGGRPRPPRHGRTRPPGLFGTRHPRSVGRRPWPTPSRVPCERLRSRGGRRVSGRARQGPGAPSEAMAATWPR